MQHNLEGNAYVKKPGKGKTVMGQKKRLEPAEHTEIALAACV